MKPRWGRVFFAPFLLVVLLCAAALLAPKIDASAAREPLARLLREATGRAVEVGEVHYQVFPLPGLSAADIVIPEDPRFGLEPVAYIGELQAGLHWPSLLAGRLQLGSVRLVDASINLAITPGAGWNVPQLLRSVLARREGSPVPKVEVRGGRINFRESTLKSPFFLNEVDLDLDPPATVGGRLSWSYEASPARSDRSESGFGRFIGKGAWIPEGPSDGRLEVDIELERSPAGEVLTLVTGRDLGLQGRLSTRAHLDGPAGDVKIAGTLRVENSGPQPFFGLTGEGWSIAYEGRLDLASQDFSVSTIAPREGELLPLQLKASCKRLLSQPQWSFSFDFDNMQAPVLIDLTRRFGVRAPDGLAVKGVVDGSIHYSQDEPPSGRVTLRNASVSLGENGPLTFEEATVALQGVEMTLEPAAMLTPDREEIELSGRWDLESETTEFRLKSPGMSLDGLRAAIDRLPNVPGLDALGACSQGTLRGELRFERRPSRPDSPASWSGEFELLNTSCTVAGAADLRVERAAIAMSGQKWSARKASGRWGPWSYAGELDHLPGSQRPYRVAFSLPEVDGEELEEFFRPALRRRMSFLERTFRSRAPLPRWLSSRHVEGVARIGKLSIAGHEATSLRLPFFWDGAVIDIPDASAAIAGGRFSGRWNIRLGGETAVSAVRGRVDGLDLGPMVLDADFNASWPGFHPRLSESLSMEGFAVARAIDLPGLPLRSAQACFEVDPRRGRERLQISCLEAFTASESYTGTAAHQETRWMLDFTGPRRQFRLSGTFSPMEWEVDARPKEGSR